jgi:hypothetical protein
MGLSRKTNGATTDESYPRAISCFKRKAKDGARLDNQPLSASVVDFYPLDDAMLGGSEYLHMFIVEY